jgi:hypothetical protein
MLDAEENRSGERSCLSGLGLTTTDGANAGLSGALDAGVFDLDIQTPSTSMPLSMARIPKGTS